MLFSENFACPEHGVSLAELEPRIFSFNSPHGACPRCTGLGAQLEVDPDLVVPDPTLAIGEGALVPWSVMNSNFYESVIQGIADRWEVDLETPWAELPQEQRDLFLNGTERRARLRPVPQPHGPQALVHALVRRHHQEPRAALPRDRLRADPRADRGVHELPCLPGVRRRPAQAGDPRGDDRRPQHPRADQAVRGRRARLPRRTRADRGGATDRRAHRQGDPRAAHVPRRRRRRLPHARPRRFDAVRRRGAAAAAGHADRLTTRRRPLHPRRALDRAPSARQRAAHHHPRAAARPR